MLWVDCTDCSLAEEQVLMRSASLLWVEWRWLWRLREPSVSPGKVKEPGRPAGDAGMELQKGAPFCRGLPGGKASFPKAGAAMGEASGDRVPARGLPRLSGPTVARGTGGGGGSSFGPPSGGTGCLRPRGLSRGLTRASLPGSCWAGSAGGGGCEGAGPWAGRDDVPDILSGPSGSEAPEPRAGEWWRRGWGRRDGWGMREGRDREPAGAFPPGATPPCMLPLGPGAPLAPPPPTWLRWYSMGDVKAAEGERETGEGVIH